MTEDHPKISSFHAYYILLFMFNVLSLGKLTGFFQFYFKVYEETAGLMVNDPVLRTRKVSIPSFSYYIYTFSS